MGGYGYGRGMLLAASMVAMAAVAGPASLAVREPGSGRKSRGGTRHYGSDHEATRPKAKSESLKRMLGKR